MNEQISLSVLMPVYNEQYLVAAALDRLKCLAAVDLLKTVEITVVDDGSRDGTGEVLRDCERRLRIEASTAQYSKLSWKFLRHEQNQGKGAAIRTALARATGDITVIQDADLEYDPRDILRLIEVFLKKTQMPFLGRAFRERAFDVPYSFGTSWRTSS